ncbi:hypothetical protein N752_10365 [Desulforamulus aquiferis]|nr:hypothetical protein [Desulforamulus aquiferis]RYD05191.1 hypothetical protein N752_10365 [Desulforamulus aquiferis]
MNAINVTAGGGNAGPLVLKWVKLVFGLLAVAVGVYLYYLGLTKIPGGEAHLELLREGDFRSGAYFYSDVEQVRTAELYLNDLNRFTPKEQ